MNYSTNLTKLYANGNSPDIIGRDKELRNIFVTLMRNEKPNVLLISEPGVGKTAMAHLLAFMISNNMCPEPLQGYKVIEINTNSLLSGPGYRGVTEEKFDNLIRESINDGKTILFFDEFHTVESLGQMANGQTPGLGNTLKPYLTQPDFRVIGATTHREFNTITDKALLRRFFVMEIGEPPREALLKISSACFKKYTAEGTKVKTECIDYAIDLSESLEGYNPDKLKDIIDLTCANAKLVAQKSITPDFLKKTFNDFYSILEQKQTRKKEEVFE